MSKRVVLVVLALLMVVPASIFAVDLIGLRVGPTAMMNTTLDFDSPNWGIDVDGIGLESFTYGADIRMNLSVIEVNALALVTALEDDYSAVALDVYANAGLSMSLFDILRLGASAGPKFTVNLGDENVIDGLDEDPMNWGLNLRLTADIELGDLSIGASAIMDTNVSLENIGDFEAATLFENPTGLFGVSAMFAIF